MKRMLAAVALVTTIGMLVGCAGAEGDAQDDSIGGETDDLIKARNRDIPLGGSARFKSFEVTVIDWNEHKLNGQWYMGLNVRVCAVGQGNPVTRSPWTVFAFNEAGGLSAELGSYPGGDWRSSSDERAVYPRSANLRAGECASGIIPFALPTLGGSKYEPLGFNYTNELGDEASWITLPAH